MDPVLEKIGLREQDYSVYEYVLRQPGCSVAEIAVALGLPAQTVTASRHVLVDRGLVHAEPPDWLEPVPSGPGAIADQLRGKLDAEYAENRRRLEALREEMTQRLGRSSPVDRSGKLHVHRLAVPAAACRQVTELLAGARREIIRITSHVRDPGGPRSANLTAELRALRRGVRVRSINPSTALIDSSGRDELRLRSQEGAAVRVVSSPPVELLVVDRRVAVVDHHQNDSVDDATVIMRGAGLVHPLRTLFETWWTIADDLTTLDPPPQQPDAAAGDSEGAFAGEAGPWYLATPDKIMLRLLGSGHKDELVAKQLGLSVRTVRRRISDLMNILDARSRFQAGLLAGQRGWI
jgi:DNA-binding CsgD family transcriptional regulator/sugar-specific transcriptional regulator TrmB